MKILFFSDNFPPECNAPASRTYAHAKYWVMQGHEVVVVTCFPNFPKGVLFKGYKNKFKRVEFMDGIKVIRIWSYISANQGTAKRLLDYISFGLHACLQGLSVKKADVVIGTSPQPFTLLPAWLIAKVKRKPFVFELRDMWPESISEVTDMKEGLLFGLFKKWIHKMYHSAALMVSVTNTFKQELIKTGISACKIAVVKNGADLQVIKPTESRKEILENYGLCPNKFYAGYVGTVGLAHSVETVVEAAKATEHESIHFIVMGGGAQFKFIEKEIAKAKISNITLLPFGSRQEAINILSALDVNIVHLKKSALFKSVIPSKIFESMALSKPILMGVDGESRDIVVDDAKCGIFFEPESADGLIEGVATLFHSPMLAKQLGESGRVFVQQYYDREVLAQKMLDALIAIEGQKECVE